MGESIRIGLARESDYSDLSSFLGERGFAVRRSPNGEPAIEVSRPAPGESLDPDVWDALTSWLATTERPLVPTVVGEHAYALTPPGE